MPEIQDYQHLPIEEVHLEWKAKPKGFRPERTVALDLAVHLNDSGRIIINYPGLGGDREGYAGKHKNLALYMQGEGLGAVVRGKGPGHRDFANFPDDVQLRRMIEYSIENALPICGAQKPEVLLMGTSAGGGAVAAVASDYEAVTRMLLMAPGNNIGSKAVENGLRDFAGEVFIVIGADDDVVGGEETGRYFLNLATRASRRELFVIPDCDHNFRGRTNGIVMSEAPFYAFAKGFRPKFPDPDGGMVLY